MAHFALGIDFGTLSARAVLVDVATGDVVASAVHAYPHKVIDERLPGAADKLPPEWALQAPGDWLECIETLVPRILETAQINADDILGIGIDFTACTVLPTAAGGQPLCEMDEWQAHPHAWPKLWKHHAAQPQADRINALAAERQEPWLPRFGGIISSEWVHAKALQILEEAPDVFAASARIVEGGDWITWQLTDRLRRNTAAAGYKALHVEGQGYPSNAFLAALHPQFDQLQAKLAGEIMLPGQPVGGLTEAWGKRLDLRAGTPVGAAHIDAHAGCLGAGVADPDTMVIIMGTSSCHMFMSHQEAFLPGISGVIKDGIAPGLFGYEAGQAGVGDIFAWFVERCVPLAYHQEAAAQGTDLHDLLTQKAQGLPAASSGLLALDWWNGCRTPLVDANLSGLLLGAHLGTRPEEIYRALIEATAYGTRLIVAGFVNEGIPVKRIVVTGGLTKNPMLVQIYADVLNQVVTVVETPQGSALGAAMLGAVAAGASRGGYDDLATAVSHMAPAQTRNYQPDPASATSYGQLYDLYTELVDLFGRDGSSIMRRLRALRDQASGQ